MKNRVVRIALVVLALAAQAAAGLFVYRAERTLAAARAEAATLSGDAARAQAAIGELRAAQTGLVANGQDPSFWVPKVEALAKDAAAAIEKIDRDRLTVDAAQGMAAAVAALADFTRTSDRIRDLLATDQPLTASSLAFGDAARHLATAAGALTGVESSQAAAVDREEAAARPREGLALAGAAALTIVALLLLLPRATRETTPADGEGPAASLTLPLTVPSSGDLDGLGRSGFDLDLRRPAAPPPTEPLPEQPRESEEAIVDDLKRETALPLNTETQVDLAAAARLCSDLARVKDAGHLPALLARAAELLDATGIVLWLAGPDGTVIRPAASVGYSDQTLSRMKALSGRSDNAVSVAFREGRMEVVAGRKDRNGAVVVPIVTVGGHAGALAAEIRHGAESSPSVQAVVTIVAAQLASLVADATATTT
jgi:hypothetical protein